MGTFFALCPPYMFHHRRPRSGLGNPCENVVGLLWVGHGLRGVDAVIEVRLNHEIDGLFLRLGVLEHVDIAQPSFVLVEPDSPRNAQSVGDESVDNQFPGFGVDAPSLLFCET